MAARESKKVI